MTHFENNILKKIFKGTLNESERKNISENLTNPKSREAIEMKQNSKKFDADLAWKKMYDEIKKESLPKSDYNNKRKQLFNSVKIAATILLFLSLSLSGYYIFTTNSSVKITSENDIKTVSLPDGSIITLNSNSEIIYPKQFAQKNRKVEFKGEAFFNISKNPKKPFIIETENAAIKVLGTSFNVNTESKKTEVIVKTGKVEMKSSDTNKIVLTPGEKGFFNAGKLQKIKNSNPNYLAWKTHFFTYENTPLSKIIADVNKVYNVNIVFGNPEIRDKIMGKATFNNDSIDMIVQIICKNFNLNSKKEGKNIVLYY